MNFKELHPYFDEIIKDDFDDLDVYANKHNLIKYEDMFQASIFKKGIIYTFDIGWYGNEVTGTYRCFIIKDCNWENPLFAFNSRRLARVFAFLKSKTEIIRNYDLI